ncbi:hypothetical protein Plhal304r1_c033g0105121 [Plasmopara halstedii]
MTTHSGLYTAWLQKQTYSIPFRPSENETQPVLPHSGQIRLCRRNFFMKCFLDKRMFMKGTKAIF